MNIPKGFRGGATKAGLKKSGAMDLGLVVSDQPCVAAGLFTKNKFAGANITVCREHLSSRSMRGLVVHAGQANACTGRQGEAVARACTETAAELTGSRKEQFIIGSTGVIGVLPKQENIQEGLRRIWDAGLTSDGMLDVGRAMMTTDLVQKTAGATLRVGGREVTILGMAKGSGMIHPSMGTMLAYVFTDLKIAKPALKQALVVATDASFNCLTVDGDTSTSDMIVAFANGAAGNEELSEKEYLLFEKKLTEVCQQLARAVARDGEGATRLVTIRVRKAVSAVDARRAAMAVGTSNLVKTAIFGRDPNWGRIACAVGYSGATFEPERVSIRLGGTNIFAHGKPMPQSREELSKYLRENEEIHLEISLGAGDAEATVWTCDFSYDYVKINAEYTT